MVIEATEPRGITDPIDLYKLLRRLDLVLQLVKDRPSLSEWWAEADKDKDGKAMDDLRHFIELIASTPIAYLADAA